MERIIENALGSIRVGLEDYRHAEKTKDPARLTSAVRNVFAGILLLAKGKLYEMSPPGKFPGILIRVVRAKLVDGQLEMVPEGSKTVGYAELKQRFADLKLPVDWRNVDQIHVVRNDLEHIYHT